MSESTQRRKYMLLSIRHLVCIAPRGSRNKIEIRSSKSETSGSSPNQSLPQKRNNVPPEISSTAFCEPHSMNLTSVCEANRLRVDPGIGCQQQHLLNRSVAS